LIVQKKHAVLNEGVLNIHGLVHVFGNPSNISPGTVGLFVPFFFVDERIDKKKRLGGVVVEPF